MRNDRQSSPTLAPSRPGPPPAERADVDYLVDAQDRIVFVVPHWEEFARANRAREETAQPLGRSLWDFITDSTMQTIYRDLLGRVRAGVSITLPFRCDAPTLRRFMELQIEPETDGGVRFRSRLLRSEPREAVLLLDSSIPRDDRRVVQCCSWCKRVEVAGTWEDLEVGVARTGFMEEGPMPLLNHGICSECEAGFTG